MEGEKMEVEEGWGGILALLVVCVAIGWAVGAAREPPVLSAVRVVTPPDVPLDYEVICHGKDDDKNVEGTMMRQDDPWLNAMGEWLEEKGMPHQARQRIEVVVHPTTTLGRGVCARESIGAHEPFALVPRTTVMSDFSARTSMVRRVYEKHGTLFRWYSSLAVHVLFEMHNVDSFWKPYLATLPTDVVTIITMNASDITRILQGTITQGQVLLLKKDVDAHLESTFRILIQEFSDLFHPEVHTFQDWLWANSIVTSRSLRVPNTVLGANGGEFSHILVPLVDMINHASGPGFTVKPKGELLAFTSLQGPFHTGEEITFSYGDQPSIVMMKNYGFAPASNPHERIDVRVELPPETPLYDVKAKILKKATVDVALSPVFLDIVALSYFRMNQLVDMHDLHVGGAIQSGEAYSRSNDVAALTEFLSLMEEQMARYDHENDDIESETRIRHVQALRSLRHAERRTVACTATMLRMRIREIHQ